MPLTVHSNVLLLPSLGSCNTSHDVASIPTSKHLLDSNTISAEHVAKGKKNFNSLLILKILCLGYVVDWGGELGRAHDHQLIANCLYFLDSEAQVTISTLRPNILFYFPTLFHFIANKAKKSK